MLREAARLLGAHSRSVIVVDKAGELGGVYRKACHAIRATISNVAASVCLCVRCVSGNNTVPHFTLGLARRVTVRDWAEVADAMRDAVIAHRPDALIVDEVLCVDRRLCCIVARQAPSSGAPCGHVAWRTAGGCGGA